MLNFIIGAVVGGFVTLFCMALVSANKRAECAECDYYKNRFLYIFNGLSAGVTTISEAEMTTEGNFIEKDFKVINLSTPREITFEGTMKVPLKWKLRWKWDIFRAKLSAYRKYRKTLKRIKELYKLERKLKNENS